MVFHLVYLYGGINLDVWRFKSGPQTIFNMAARTLEPTGIYWPGLGFFVGGGAVMLALTWARQRLLWWPLHPLGFPIGANMLMNPIWFSVFIAWTIKTVVLEVRIPFRQILEGFAPRVGARIGFDISPEDEDVAGEGRDGQMFWVHRDVDAWTDVSQWGTLIFAGPMPISTGVETRGDRGETP